MQYRIV